MNEKYGRRLALMVITLVSACATAESAGPGGGGEVGSPVPEMKLRGFDGRKFNPRALEGQVVLLDIWASWCAPCKEELPLLDSMAARLRGKGVTVLAISIDESKEDALGFLKTRGADWALSLAHDPEGKVAERLKPSRMPTSYIIDREGIIRHVNAGFERADLAKIEARLTQLAAQP